jgi:hypothetical protein
MSGETEVVSTETPGSVPENTETPKEVTATPEEVTEPVAPKTYSEEEVQERIERATAKAAAKAERRAFREAAEALQRQPAPQQRVDDKPARAQYADEEQYIDALTDWKLDQRERESQQSKAVEAQKTTAEKTEAMYKEAAKLPGFDREEFESLPLTRPIAQVLMESDAPAKLMAYMSANPDEVERIAGLSPVKQVAEMGKLEAKLSSAPVKTTKAPAPINPVGAGSSQSRDLAKLSTADYIEQRRKQNPIWAR